MKLVTPMSSLFLIMMTMDIVMDTGALVIETMDIEAVEDIAMDTRAPVIETMDIEAMGETDTTNTWIYLFLVHTT